MLVIALVLPLVMGPASLDGSQREGTGGTAAVESLEVPRVVRGNLGQKIDELARGAEVFGFNGQVLVEKDGAVVLHEAYGYADPRSGREMTVETPVGVASVSKQFAAAAVLRLVEGGHVALGDSLPLFFEGVPEEKRGITLHHLLIHTSGVRSGYADEFEPATQEALTRDILMQPLAFEPGTRWRYSGAGYNLVAAIVERVSGEGYGGFLRRAFFEPAGMGNTRLVNGGGWEGEGPADAYVGWIDHASPDEWPLDPRAFGAGDLVTTAADLYRWENSLRDGTVLAPESVSCMSSVQHALNEENGYGYGFFIHRSTEGRTVVEHGGDARLGYNAAYFRYPDEGSLVLITSNSRTPAGESLRHALGLRIERLLRGEMPTLPPEADFLDASRVDRLAGTYRLELGPASEQEEAWLHLVSDGVRLWLAPTGQGAIDLLEPWSARNGDEAAGDDASRKPGFRRANEKTRTLLAGLIDRADSLAFERALTDEGAEHLKGYLDDWRSLVESRGPLHAFRVQGSRPLGRDDAATRAQLRFRSGVVTLTYFWANGGAGRLRGSFVHLEPFRPAIALAIGRGPAGNFIAHDPVGGETVTFRVPPGTGEPVLQILGPRGPGSATGYPVGLGGWTPPFGY